MISATRRLAAVCLCVLVPLVVQGQDKEKEKPGAEAHSGHMARFKSDGGDFEVALTGYAQGDVRSYENWTPESPNTSELRRLRVGVEGKWKALSFEVNVDPRNDISDSSEGSQQLKNAFLEYKFSKALRLRAGHFKTPFGVEFQTSAAKTDFIEHPLLSTSVGLGRDWGGMAYGDVGKRWGYQAAVQVGDGSRTHESSELSFAGRVTANVVKGLDLGASWTQADVKADPEPETADPRPKGFVGDSPTDFRFFVRHFVDGARRRAGADAAYRRGPFGFKAEAVDVREERKGQGSTFDDLPDETTRGWLVSATWLVTGEKKKGTIKPDHPFPHGIGAIEVGAGYDTLRFDDDGPSSGFAGAGNRARNILRTGEDVFTGGVSWWPVEWVRLMGNVVVEKYVDGLLAPERGRRGQYVTWLGRLQVQIP